MILRQITLILVLLTLSATGVKAQDSSSKFNSILIAPVQVSKAAQKLGVTSDFASIYLMIEVDPKNRNKAKFGSLEFYDTSPMLSRLLNQVADSRNQSDNAKKMISKLRDFSRYRKVDLVMFTYLTAIKHGDTVKFDAAFELRDPKTLQREGSYSSQTSQTSPTNWRTAVTRAAEYLPSLINSMNERRAKNSTSKAFLGVHFEQLGENQVQITKIILDSAAQKADLRPGDIITQINDTAIQKIADFHEQFKSFDVGTTITLKILRQKYRLEKLVTLGEQPSEMTIAPKPKQGVLGISVEPAFSGVEITTVVDNQPAKLAGLEVGDLIVRVNDKDVLNFEQLRIALDPYKPGDTVVLTVRRNKVERNVKVVLADPDAPKKTQQQKPNNNQENIEGENPGKKAPK